MYKQALIKNIDQVAKTGIFQFGSSNIELIKVVIKIRLQKFI